MEIDDSSVVLDDIDSLADALSEDLPGDVIADGTPVEEPPASDEDGEQEQVHDDEDPDTDDPDAEDDPDSDEDEGEDEEDPDAEDDDDPKAVASLQKRVDTLTAKWKSAEERAEKLEEELEQAEKQAKASPKVQANGKQFRSVDDVNARERDLDTLIAELDDEVTGLPVYEMNEDGERVEATVEIRGNRYTVKAVRAHLRDLQNEQRSLPQVRKQLEQKAAEDAEARKILPQAWQRGTKAYDVRKALVKEFPELADVGTGALVAAVAGRLAMMRQKERVAAAQVKKPLRVKPAAGKGVKPSKKKSERKAKVSEFMQVDGVDPEVAALAADLE